MKGVNEDLEKNLFRFDNLGDWFKESYGNDLENTYDKDMCNKCGTRLFCLDCHRHYLQYRKSDPLNKPIRMLPENEQCQGLSEDWENCSHRAEALKIIREEL